MDINVIKFLIILGCILVKHSNVNSFNYFLKLRIYIHIYNKNADLFFQKFLQLIKIKFKLMMNNHKL